MLLRFGETISWITILFVNASVASGQDFPSKPIRIIAGLAGGGGDSVARTIAQGTTAAFGQAVIVDNRGSSAIAAEVVAKAPPDGYTLTIQGSGIWILPLLQKTPYDMSDFSPVSLLLREVNILAVHPSVPVKSVKELIALAKARPGELNYGSGGIGGPTNIATELFKSMAGVDIVRISYKGNAQSITGLLSGEIQVMIFDARLLAPHVKAGRLRALAVTSAEPSALAPGLPTVSAAGVPGYEAVGSLTVMFAPAKTPAVVINRLNQEIVRFLNRADVKERFLSEGAEVVGNSPEQFAAIIKSDTARTSMVIRDIGIRISN